MPSSSRHFVGFGKEESNSGYIQPISPDEEIHKPHPTSRSNGPHEKTSGVRHNYRIGLTQRSDNTQGKSDCNQTNWIEADMETIPNRELQLPTGTTWARAQRVQGSNAPASAALKRPPVPVPTINTSCDTNRGEIKGNGFAGGKGLEGSRQITSNKDTQKPRIGKREIRDKRSLNN